MTSGKLRATLLALVGATIPLWGLAAAEENSLVRLFALLGIILVAGKFSGEVFERWKLPPVLGELLMGTLLGVGALGIIPTAPTDPLTPFVHGLAEIGVVVLLFEIGLETDLKQLFRVGPAATSVAVVGVAVPLALGLLYWISPLGHAEFNLVSPLMTGVFIGATLCATSVGITARVLGDLQVLSSVEARIIVGAAVVDDVLGLVLLGLVGALAAGTSLGVLDVARSLAVAIGFFVIAIGLGRTLAPRVFSVIDRMRVRGVLLVSAFAFALLIAALAQLAGSAAIVGAFAAGVILSGTNQFDAIEERIKPVADIFTPIFFLSIGAQFDLRLLNPLDPANRATLAVGAVLMLIAILGKLVAGWAVPWLRLNRAALGAGMVPRGEVGLIFADLGLSGGVLSRELFGAIMIMVAGTTFIAPPLLKWSFRRYGVTRSMAESSTPPVPSRSADAPHGGSQP